MRKHFKTTAAVAAAASTVLVAGCGGGPQGSGGAVSGDKIVIGVINDASGVYKDLSGPGSVAAIQMAVADFKAKYGDKAVTSNIEVITTDHQNKPDVANSKAQEMYDRNGADLILDVPTSSAALAVATQAKNKKRVYINVGAGTSALTGASCNKYTFHWAYDTWMLANGTASTITKAGGKKWSIVYPDYEFGQASDKLYTAAIEANGGTVTAHLPTPFPNDNFATFITKAVETKPDVIASMHGGGDLVNFVKQLNQSGQLSDDLQLVAGVLFLSDIRALGVDQLSGTKFTDGWYWNMDDESRAWADRFKEKVGTRPTSVHAGNYSAALQYLEAVQAAGTDNAEKVVANLEGKKINDIFLRNGRVRAEDHRVIHDVYLAEVKAKDEVKTDEDFEKILSTIPAEEAFRPVAESDCSM